MTASKATLRSRVSAALGVEAGEGRAISLTVGLYFLLAAAFVFIQTTAYGLFIEEYGARNLPFAYLSIAIFASLLAYLYLRLSGRLAFKTLYFLDLGFLAAVCIVFWLGLRSGLAHWFVFFLPFWFQTIINLANLVVWPLAGRLFDVRQAKRLFGLVGAGNWMGNIVFGGFVVAPLLALVGASNLYLFAGAAVVAGLFVLWILFRSNLLPASSSQPAAQALRPGLPEKPAASPLKNPYYRLIFGYILVWWVGFYFIDNIFYDRAGAMFPDAAQLAAFIGRQLSVIGIIALFTSIVLTGLIVRRFGVRAGLLTEPAIVIFFMFLLAIAGILHASVSVQFWLAAAAKTFNVALGFSLSTAVYTLLFQPLPGNESHRTLTIAEGIVQPVAIGFAGLLLLFFNTALHFSAVGLSVIFLLISVLWVGVVLRLCWHYPKVLTQALVKRTLGESTTLLFDPVGVAQLQAGLKSPNAAAVLYALSQLEQVDPQVWQTTLRAALPDLLAHPSPDVRSYVLRRILSLKATGALPLVRSRLPSESDPQVRATAVELLAALDNGSAEEVSGALASPERIVRQGAISGLLTSGDQAKIERARMPLEDLVGSPDPQDRLTAAEILSGAVCPGSKLYISRLLADEVLLIRQSAVRAAGRQEESGLLEELVLACDRPDTAWIAELTLASKGAAALPVILVGLERMDAMPARQGALGLVRLLGTIGGDEALSALQSRMDYPDAELRLEVLRALGKLDYRVRSLNSMRECLQMEIGQAAWLTASLELLGKHKPSPDLTILAAALADGLRDTRGRVLLLLSFGLDRQAVLRAAKALDEADGSPPAFAVEAVDAMLPSAWKPLILPLIENIDPAERLSRWRASSIQPPVLSMDVLLETLVAPGTRARLSRWATMCALHVAGVLKVLACEPAARALSSVPDPALSEISCWSLAEMGFDVPLKKGAVMLSLVEKVLALKSASVFRETPDDVLADVASQVEERVFDKDEVIFRKGDYGDSLYIIVSGRVEVRDGERLLNELDEGAIFGELALLDPAPRSATIRSLEPAHLLQLNEAGFRAVLAERPEVSAAIIHVLTSYIRNLLASDEAVEAARKDPETFEP